MHLRAAPGAETALVQTSATFLGGVEARISLPQTKFGLKGSLRWGSPATELWVGPGIFAHKLWHTARVMWRSNKMGQGWLGSTQPSTQQPLGTAQPESFRGN